MGVPERVIVRHCDRERLVEVIDGPRKLFGNSDAEYYEGWVMPEALDPYGEPYHIVFPADAVVRRA